MSESLCPITDLPIGAKATVAEINVPPQHRGRLLEMGLLNGTALELIRFAPMGDPVEIKVRGYHLTLRRAEAELIMVRALTR
ncbi:MAG: FeoA family protein [Verrucomicrobiales bacterium]|jgi:ferrous iron transport protein A|nr:FeoA family protein [Verrucomicrobiales bacterium]MDB6130944.1 FeoA family protein [Verrucomicrobiales bacterium]